MEKSLKSGNRLRGMAIRSFFGDRELTIEKMKKAGVFLILLISPRLLVGAGDEIIPFEETWAVIVAGKYVVASFSPEEPGSYTTDRPWALGFGLRYKNNSLSLFLPSFYAFDDTPFESFDVQLASYYDSVYYEAFCKRYRGFSNGEAENKIIDLKIFSSGISVGWVQNNKNHSLSAVHDLDRRQLSSSGSVLLGFGVFYTSIFSDDANIKRYNDNQHLLYFGPAVGYSYTFIFPHSIFLNLSLAASLDAGININAGTWLFVPKVTPRLSFGHHNSTWSMNVSVGCDYTAILWNMNTVDYLMPATMTVTFSKRFGKKD
jgi:hypothetical protein